MKHKTTIWIMHRHSKRFLSSVNSHLEAQISDFGYNGPAMVARWRMMRWLGMVCFGALVFVVRTHCILFRVVISVETVTIKWIMFCIYRIRRNEFLKNTLMFALAVLKVDVKIV
jgi:hypothetical protein